MPILGDVSKPQVLFTIIGVGISILAIASALLQFVQSRMMLPPPDPENTDPNVRIQRQMMLFLPAISVLYGGYACRPVSSTGSWQRSFRSSSST